MKTIIIPALLCVMSFSTAAFAADAATTKESPVAMSSINSGDELTKAEEIIINKNAPITDAWQDDPNKFTY